MDDNNSNEQTELNGQDKKKKIIFILLLLLIAAGIIMFLFSLNNNDDTDKSETATTTGKTDSSSTTSPAKNGTTVDSTADEAKTEVDGATDKTTETEPTPTEPTPTEPTPTNPSPSTEPLIRPTITLTQDNDTVSASTDGLSGHQYFTDTSDPDCSDDYQQWSSADIGASKSGLTDDIWICFRAQNSEGVYGFAELQVDLTLPPLTLTQNNDSVMSAGTNLTGYEYFHGSADPNCDADDTYTGTGSTASNIPDTDWVCFKAKNKLGVYGYAKLQVDLTQPSISLTQKNDSVIATPSSLTGHKYFSDSDDPDCDADDTYTESGNTANNIANGHWVCFKARNNLNVYGYAKLQVDLTQPKIKLTPNGDNVTASGADLEGYEYFSGSTDPNCDADDTYTGMGDTASGIPRTHWVCFKAKNGLGVYGYAKLQTPAPQPPAPPPGSTPQDPGLN